jgi:hypothetical protein
MLRMNVARAKPSCAPPTTSRIEIEPVRSCPFLWEGP